MTRTVLVTDADESLAPAAVGAAVALWWLASPGVSSVVGNVLTLDGGWTPG
jgi:NAD(P)-dependent dehydrogenase (short-subunit alcohol dehydrogenase family)